MRGKNKKRVTKRKKLRNERGITLLALVVTIIVLLILAGIGIGTLFGENSILTKASESKEETRGASVEEARDLWKINQEADSMVASVTSQTLEELIDDLVTQKLLTEDEKDQILGNESKGIEATYKITIGSKTIEFKKIEETTLAEEITPTNYGDYINYNVDLNDDGDTTNDWRIFYADGTNVFIIAADYLSNEKLPDETDMVKQAGYSYSAYWTEANLTKAGASAISSDVANKYMLNWLTTNPDSTNNNAKAVADLLDTSVWSSFATGVTGAEAIGGPTLEMYVASWNAKEYTQLYCNNSTSAGYYIGNTSEPTSYSVKMNSDANGYADTLYYPHTSSYNNCYGYWLAAPSADSSAYVMYIQYNGVIYGTTFNSARYCVRPLVCLPSNIKGNKGIGGIWIIQE